MMGDLLICTYIELTSDADPRLFPKAVSAVLEAPGRCRSQSGSALITFALASDRWITPGRETRASSRTSCYRCRPENLASRCLPGGRLRYAKRAPTIRQEGFYDTPSGLLRYAKRAPTMCPLRDMGNFMGNLSRLTLATIADQATQEMNAELI